jgi:hypothetical protein
MIKPVRAITKSKSLSRLRPAFQTMKRGVGSELKGEELDRAIKEAQKDPEFMREINKFIKVTTS